MDLYFVVCDDCGRGATSQSAGMITRSNGKIAKYDDEGGSFKENDLSMPGLAFTKYFWRSKDAEDAYRMGLHR